MSLDLMPDDCLLHIFDFIYDPLVLFRSLRVCRRWNRLVSYRLAKVERVLDDVSVVNVKLNEKYLSHDMTNGPLTEPILSSIIRKSPKLKLVSIGLENHDKKAEPKNWRQLCINRLCKLKSLERLILTAVLPEEIDFLPQSIDFLSSSDTYIRNGYYPRVKQLLVEDDVFIDSIRRFPNIERLNLKIPCGQEEWFEEACKSENVYPNLRMVEIDTTYEENMDIEENYAVQFIDLCPVLESAHLKIAIDQSIPDDDLVHLNLVNLVLTLVDLEQIHDQVDNLVLLLTRYPNIKHLAIKFDTFFIERSENNDGLQSDLESNEDEEDEYGAKITEPKKYKDGGINGVAIVYIIVNMLKNLVLLDMRNITGIDKTCAEYIERYCKRNKRKLKFYFGSTGNNEIKRDWPELFDKGKDSRELDFMKQFFLIDYVDCFARLT